LAKRSGADQDVVRGTESVVGGAGDDRLRGDANSNVIDGGGGRDELRGRGGDDQFSNGGGRTSCGTGVDIFLKPRSTDILESDCETVSPVSNHGT
jgi:Ca2+-binding RTX toxin-like protein